VTTPATTPIAPPAATTAPAIAPPPSAVAAPSRPHPAAADQTPTEVPAKTVGETLARLGIVPVTATFAGDAVSGAGVVSMMVQAYAATGTVGAVAPPTVIAPIATRTIAHVRRSERQPTRLRGPPEPLQTPASPVATGGGASAAAGGASGGRDLSLQVDALVLELPDGAPAVASDRWAPAAPATTSAGARAPPIA